MKGGDRMPKGHKLPEAGKSPVSWEFMLALRELGADRVNLNDCEAIESRVDAYFKLCAKYNACPTKLGLSQALGCTTYDALHDRTRGTRSDRPSSQVLQKAVSFIEAYIEQLALKGGQYSIGAFFVLKCSFHWKEVHETTVTHKYELSDGLSSPAELEQKYAELPVQDAEYEELPVQDAEFEVLDAE